MKTAFRSSPSCVRPEEMRSDHGNHRRVVGAENRWRNENLDPRGRFFGPETFLQAAVCGHPPQTTTRVPRPSPRRAGVFPPERRRSPPDSKAVRSGNSSGVKGAPPFPESRQKGGLQTAEAEIQAFPHRPWKWKRLAVTMLRETVDHHPSGITDLQQFCGLVEGLSRRIISRLAQYGESLKAIHPDKWSYGRRKPPARRTGMPGSAVRNAAATCPPGD